MKIQKLDSKKLMTNRHTNMWVVVKTHGMEFVGFDCTDEHMVLLSPQGGFLVAEKVDDHRNETNLKKANRCVDLSIDESCIYETFEEARQICIKAA